MGAEATIKSMAIRLAEGCPGLSPEELAADILEGLARSGDPIPSNAPSLASAAARTALSASAWRRRNGMPDSAWHGADVADLRPATLPMIDPSLWAGKPVPARQWLLDEWIPERTTTLFTGDGGAGKSLMAQQLATHIAMGMPFMGIPTKAVTSLYITCEDEDEELHRRQDAICASLGVRLAQLSRKLHLMSLVDQCAPLAKFTKDGDMTVTSAFDHLRATVQTNGIRFLVLDNVAHLFGGNEIVKLEVAAFLGLINKLAKRANCTILLLGHLNKAGDEYSGNVAWQNQVRSRIFLNTPIEDGNARVLSRGKANYAKRGETLGFVWHNWAFVRDSDVPPDEMAANVEAMVNSADDKAFLHCLDAATRQRVNVSHMPSANYAPKIFAGMPEGAGHRKLAFEKAMRRLISTGAIVVDVELWGSGNRHPKRGIKRAPDCAKPSEAEG